jgi:tRNA pseudouridine55 synthase
MSETPSGLLVLDKPKGRTSYDCVHRVKLTSGLARVGHCGTLDPQAEGVLLVLVGKATRCQDGMLGLKKTYWLRAELGRQSSTGDRDGVIEKESEFRHISRSQLEATLVDFRGDISQVPPRYAALKYRGKPYYAYARKGIEIPRSARTVQVYDIQLLDFEPPYWEARVECARGTYIRTLVEDISVRLGTVGLLDALIREAVGPYRREAGIDWQRLGAMDRTTLLSQLQTPLPAS